MDFQFWLYIIIGIIYILGRILKKQEPEQPKEPRESHQEGHRRPAKPVENQPKPLTFEELLKELTEAKQVSKPEYRQEPPRHEREVVIDYDDNLEEEAKSLETTTSETVNYEEADNNKRYADYQEGKRLAIERRSLEETMNIRDTVVEFGKFKEFSEVKQKNLLAEYTKDFQDPEGLKKAIVMGEILQRRFQY